MVYVDDGTLIHKDQREIDKVIKQLRESFKLTEKGKLSDYLGVNIEYLKGNKMKLSQPHLIDQIIKDINCRTKEGTYKIKPREVPAKTTVILDKDKGGEPHSADWNYRSIIG